MRREGREESIRLLNRIHFYTPMPEPEQRRGKLEMEYVPTVLVDFNYILAHTSPSHEVQGRYGENHIPLKNQGRFGSAAGQTR